MSVCRMSSPTSLGLSGGFRLLPSGDQVCLVVCGQEFVSLRQTEYRYGNMSKIGLTDTQLRIVMDASASLEPERRAVRPPLLI